MKKKIRPHPQIYYNLWDVIKYLDYTENDLWEWLTQEDRDLIIIDECCLVNKDMLPVDVDDKTKEFMGAVLKEFGDIKDLGVDRPIGGWTQVALCR